MAEPEPHPIEADQEVNQINDGDSTLGAGHTVSSTSSIRSSILKYREENGRTYHAYKDGKYLSPNDERENDRLDLQHHLFMLTFGDKLYTCPADTAKQVQRVLDVGTGTGIWAIDFADEHPGAQIIGIDLSPIQPSFVPPNLTFQIDDLDDPWTFAYKFDFIYSRMMTTSVSDWPRFFEQAYENLNPGGWIELADIVFPVKVDDDTWPEDSALQKWSAIQLDATIKAGRPINSAESYKSQLADAGFTDIVETVYKWPTNHWPKDKKLKELGIWNLENVMPSLEGFSMALFTRVLGWSRQEVEVFLVKVRKELKDPKIHGYWPIYVVYAKKPE
ncbi:S-adenosyl-L-methionine-dependent methyltransferase [Thelonectria olida]|uniref:S-adenosyl-L-methionine-dependent methyltransferase n=1 Tax=Thelonectria olida TaxID=1576542 RepID=A0A9P9AIF5_9HYPO|nr:S-adenosyl-L-methionine-dependent methyltransferase [Thelonectria olida]